MPHFEFLWIDEVVEHLAEHGLTPDDFELVVTKSQRRSLSRSTGRPCCWGEALDGRYIICVYEYIDEVTVIPITAYGVRRPKR